MIDILNVALKKIETASRLLRRAARRLGKVLLQLSRHEKERRRSDLLKVESTD